MQLLRNATSQALATTPPPSTLPSLQRPLSIYLTHLQSMIIVMTIRSGAEINPNALAQKSLSVLASELTRLNSLPAVRCCRSEGANTSTCCYRVVGVCLFVEKEGECKTSMQIMRKLNTSERNSSAMFSKRLLPSSCS